MSDRGRGETCVRFNDKPFIPFLTDHSYNRKDPATFLPGDIVEVQASFACFPARNGQSTLGIVMRGLTLLDDKFSKV